VYPSAPESANGIDDDCDGTIDEGTNAYDDDGDGYTEDQGDCNDANGSINPNAAEVCGDGLDNNCNNSQNEQNASSCTTFYRDSDGDGYGDQAFSECWCSAGGSTGTFSVTNTSDCYDGNPLAHPGQSGYFTSSRGDGSFDYNCDGSQSKQYVSSGTCDSFGSSIGDCTLNTAGWDGSIPNCGSTGNYLVDNDSCSAGCHWFGVPTCCEVGGPSYVSVTQSCQ
jgi:hypothetical protein